MDVDIEKLNSLLLDTKLPSTIHDLRNPTEEFVMNLITTFLKRFNIDVNLISKPTFQQQDIVTCLEDNDIIDIINLYVAIRQILDRIFIPEFYISDITNSGPKKVRKFAGYLANFLLYATYKESDIGGRINEIHVKSRSLEELQKKKTEIIRLKNEKAIKISKQLSVKEKYIREIEQLRSQIENNKKKMIDEEMSVIEEKRQKVLEEHNTHKLEVQRLDKIIADLKSEVVNSPQKYKARLYNLEEQSKTNIEERAQMQETFLAKKQLVKRYENILSFIQEQYEKFYEIKDKYEHLRTVNIQRENIKKQVDTMKNNIKETIKERETLEDQNSTIYKIAQTDKRLHALRELHAQLLSERKSRATKLEENIILYNDLSIEKSKIQSLIEKIEEETSTFIKSSQERYNNEIANEVNLWNCFNNAWEGSDDSPV